jgi:hypothetical protein
MLSEPEEVVLTEVLSRCRSQRLVDNLPGYFDYEVLRELEHKIASALLFKINLSTAEDIKHLMRESPEVSRRRKNLKRRRKGLESSKLVLRSFHKDLMTTA